MLVKFTKENVTHFTNSVIEQSDRYLTGIEFFGSTTALEWCGNQIDCGYTPSINDTNLVIWKNKDKSPSFSCEAGEGVFYRKVTLVTQNDEWFFENPFITEPEPLTKTNTEEKNNLLKQLLEKEFQEVQTQLANLAARSMLIKQMIAEL